MTAALSEAPSDSLEKAAQQGAAFGMALEIDPRIELRGLGPAGVAAVTQPRTRVLLDPEGVTQRWGATEQAPLRVREARVGEQLMLTVDFTADAGYLMWVSACGRTLISTDGTELLCQPEPRCPDWSAMLSNQALPLAATLRGLEPLHASGVAIGGRARLFAGVPGAGKSSIAAALIRRGAELLGDDGVVLERRGDSLVAHPGMRSVHLRHAEAERLSSVERAALGTATRPPKTPAGHTREGYTGKRRYVAERLAGPTAFGELFLLERSLEGPIIERMDPIDPFALLATTFALSARTPERLQSHLDMVTLIAATGSVYRLRVQPGMDATRLAERLEEHFAQG